MSIVCTSLPSATVAELNAQIKTLPANHALRRDNMTYIIRQDDVVLFRGSSGAMYYVRSSAPIEDVIREDIAQQERPYLCSIFVVDSMDLVGKMLERFQENHGVKMARQIDHYIYHFNGEILMLVKLPSCVVRHMLAPTGGLLKTTYSGPVDSIKRLDTLSRFVGYYKDDEIHDGRIKSVFATQYGEGMLPIVERIHYDVLRDVIKHPNLGLCVGPIGQWDSV